MQENDSSVVFKAKEFDMEECLGGEIATPDRRHTVGSSNKINILIEGASPSHPAHYHSQVIIDECQ